MRNSYPFKIGTKLDNSVCPDYRPDGRVRPGHLAGLQTDHFFTHLAWRDDGRQTARAFLDHYPKAAYMSEVEHGASYPTGGASSP